MSAKVFQFIPRREPMLAAMVRLVRARASREEIESAILPRYPNASDTEFEAALDSALLYIYPESAGHGGGAA